MAITRTVFEGDPNKPEPRRNRDATSVETSTGTGLPSFIGAGRKKESDKTMMYSPADGQALTKGKLIGWLYTFSLAPEGQSFELREGRNEIGRKASNDIVLEHESVSQEHCYIMHYAMQQKTFIVDNKSMNGTFVDGTPALTPCELKDGDNISIGSVQCAVRLVKETEANQQQ